MFLSFRVARRESERESVPREGQQRETCVCLCLCCVFVCMCCVVFFFFPIENARRGQWESKGKIKRKRRGGKREELNIK